MKKTLNLIIGLSILSASLLFTLPVSAQTTKGNVVRDGDIIYLSKDVDTVTLVASDSTASTNTDIIQVPEGFAESFSGLINGLLSVIMVIAALLVFFYLIWGALNWITSGGDKSKTDSARQKIISAIIGLLIIAASFAVINLIVNFLGFESLNDVFTNIRTIEGDTTTIE